MAVRGEVDRIFAHALSAGMRFPQPITRISRNWYRQEPDSAQAEAEKRVSDVFGEFQQSADRARKALAHLSLWLFVALLERSVLRKLCRHDRRQAARSREDIEDDPGS